MNKKVNKKNVRKPMKLKSKNVVLVLGLIYTLISILAVISYVSRINTISTTPVTVVSVLGSIWWQILMVVLFGVVYVLYSKKPTLGTLLEMIMGIAMIVYIMISVVMIGIDIFALLIELMYPLILIFHGFIEYKKVTKNLK